MRARTFARAHVRARARTRARACKDGACARVARALRGGCAVSAFVEASTIKSNFFKYFFLQIEIILVKPT